MQTAIESTPLNHNAELTDALATARGAVHALGEEGISVLAVTANGRRPLLIIDRMPHGVVSVIKRSHPNGLGGIAVVRAAQWHGCQLEAMHDPQFELIKRTVRSCPRLLERCR